METIENICTKREKPEKPKRENSAEFRHSLIQPWHHWGRVLLGGVRAMPSCSPPHHSTWAIAALYTLLAIVRNDSRSPDLEPLSAPVSVCARFLLLEGDSRQQLLSPAWRSCWRRWRRGLKQVAAAAKPFLSGALCLHSWMGKLCSASNVSLSK